MSTPEEVGDLQAESETPSPVKTFRRIVLTVTSPMRAMRHVAYDPDLLVIPIIFLLLALYAFFQPFVIMGKMEIPGEVNLYSPETINMTGSIYLTVSELKSEAQKLYWGSSLTYYALLVVITFVILIVAARVIMGSVQYKVMVSGASYSGLALFLLGLVWLASMFLIPSVVIPYSTSGNMTYMTWPGGAADFAKLRTATVLTNFTLAGDLDDGQLWTIEFSTSLLQAGTTSQIERQVLRGRVQGGLLVVMLHNGTERLVQPGGSLSVPTANISFVTQGGKTYLLDPDGLRLELQQNAVVRLETALEMGQNVSDASKVSWVSSGMILVRPQQLRLTNNASAPTNLAGDESHKYWSLSVSLREDMTAELLINMTASHALETDRGSLTWTSESVVAQPGTLMTYFNRLLAAQMPSQLELVLQWVLPALSKAWQSVILLCLVKASYEDATWLRSAIVVAAHQGALLFLGF